MMMQKIRDVMNGESKSIAMNVLIYATVSVSVLSNIILTFWHHPFSYLVVHEIRKYSATNYLLDMFFIFGFLFSNTFVQLLCTDMALTRITRFQYPSFFSSSSTKKQLIVGSIHDNYRPLALSYSLISVMGLGSMLLLSMYGRELGKMGFSLGTMAAIYGIGMASITMMLLGGLVLAGCAITVSKWKSSVKRCSSICFSTSDSKIVESSDQVQITKCNA